MVSIVTGNKTGAGAGRIIILPGVLTRGADAQGNNGCVKIDQAVLLAAVRIMAGVTRTEGMEGMQVLSTVPEIGGGR